ncbi:monocarboxylate transporter 7-like [Strongylocentrotus purpuratus]|uniref:Major facilitator superfamily (MFS) profile domain-containing protein n=1 Tax=Strongylocentrotus purpuratus TaxID=7668 RepID=A0A7M7N813_STRPU|nr:monocarboxylate transporter 7-like [Strongylocentrotus purpuratus]
MMLTSAVRSVWVIGALFMAAGALSSPVFQTSHVLLHEYFNHRYAAANALASTGAQAGGIVLPIVTSHVLIAYGVEGALLCLGVIFLNFVVIASLLRPIKVRVTGVEEDAIAVDTSCPVDNHPSRNINIQTRDETAGPKHKGLIKGYLLRTGSWLADVTYFQTLRAEKVYCTLILPSVFLHQIAYIGWALFMVPYVHSFGMSPSREAYLPVTGAIGGLFGRLTAGGVLYLRPKWGKRTLVSGTIISSVGLLIFGLLHSHISQFISTFLAGFGLFATFTSFYAILHDSVAKENFSGIIAFTSFIRGFGVATGGYATGLIFELTGSFAVAFRVLACMDAAILILIFSFALIKKIN